jgi:hypothetical protein
MTCDSDIQLLQLFKHILILVVHIIFSDNRSMHLCVLTYMYKNIYTYAHKDMSIDMYSHVHMILALCVIQK